MLNSISITTASAATKRAASALLLESGSAVDGGTTMLDTSVIRLSA